MTEFRRIIKAGFVNFGRTGATSWAAVLVVTITLSVIGAILLLSAVLNNALFEIKEKVDVTIYFVVGAPENRILSLKESLEKLPEVDKITYVGAEEALALFRERHKNDYPTIAALDEINENPLGAYLNVKAKEVSQYESIANFMKEDSALSSGYSSIVDKVNYHQNKLVIDRLSNIIGGAQKLGLILTFLLIIVSVVITFNTIRLTIFIAREEISVMRLVGASKMRVRGPFMVEGAIYGIIATAFALVLFLPATAYLSSNLGNFLGLDLYAYYTDNLLQFIVILLLSGVVLGMISSFIAVRKYLNK